MGIEEKIQVFLLVTSLVEIVTTVLLVLGGIKIYLKK